jgi:hypothetical protein
MHLWAVDNMYNFDDSIFGMTTHFKIGSSHYDKIKTFWFQFWILLIKNNNNGNFIFMKNKYTNVLTYFKSSNYYFT